MSRITSAEYHAGYKAGYADAHRAALADFKREQPTIHFLEAEGQTLEEMRRHVHMSRLYAMGDARLVWVNEGDFWGHPSVRRCERGDAWRGD